MNFFETYKKQIFILLAIVLVLCSFITAGLKQQTGLVGSAVGFVITPLQKLSSSVTGYVGEQIASLSQERDLEAENEELKAQVALLQAENKRLSLYEEENKRLSDLLDMAQKYPDYDSIGALVIAKDPGNWFDTFLIDAGKNKGILPDMVVMEAEGIIGRITETGPNYSQVQSILDSRSSVSAMSLRTGDLGVVRGDYTLMNQGLCRMEYIDAESEIMTGDEIVTSGLSDVYPPGLTIGYVQEVITDANGLTKYAIIAPAVDFKHISSVLVLSEEISSDETTQTESVADEPAADADTTDETTTQPPAQEGGQTP